MIFKLEEYKKRGQIFEFSVYRRYGEVGIQGSLVCPLWGSFLSYMPQRTGRHVYSPPLMNGRFREGKHFFRQILLKLPTEYKEEEHKKHILIAVTNIR